MGSRCGFRGRNLDSHWWDLGTVLGAGIAVEAAVLGILWGASTKAFHHERHEGTRRKAGRRLGLCEERPNPHPQWLWRGYWRASHGGAIFKAELVVETVGVWRRNLPTGKIASGLRSYRCLCWPSALWRSCTCWWRGLSRAVPQNQSVVRWSGLDLSIHGFPALRAGLSHFAASRLAYELFQRSWSRRVS